LKKKGNKNINAACDEETPLFTAAEWGSFDEMQKEKILSENTASLPNLKTMV